jgi:ribonuclease BN (tRNA processing enzyme)
VINSIKNFNVDYKDIDAIFITHFHGDHFAGIPFYVIDVRLYDRQKPLYIFGPAGVKKKVTDLMELLYPGTTIIEVGAFPIMFQEYSALPHSWGGGRGRNLLWRDVSGKVFTVKHSRAARPNCLRFEIEGKVIAYSGDTEWCDALVAASADAGLFICECSHLKPFEGHMDAETLLANKSKLTCKRLVLTHCGEAVLQDAPNLPFEFAYDGMVIEL